MKTLFAAALATFLAFSTQAAVNNLDLPGLLTTNMIIGPGLSTNATGTPGANATVWSLPEALEGGVYVQARATTVVSGSGTSAISASIVFALSADGTNWTDNPRPVLYVAANGTNSSWYGTNFADATWSRAPFAKIISITTVATNSPITIGPVYPVGGNPLGVSRTRDIAQ